MERKKYIDILKCLAVLLVLNSHLDSIYPVAALATGGAIGNCLFFMVSGYTWANIKEKSFLKWIKKKLKAIWTPTVLTNFLYVIIYVGIMQMTLVKGIEIFLYPNKSWFCGAILLYALLYYWIVKKNSNKIFIWTFIVLGIVYIVDYIFFIDKSMFSIETFSPVNLCRIIFYFMCMLIGYFYRENKIKNLLRKDVNLILSILSFVSIYIMKYLMSRYSILLNIQFLNQICTLLCVFFLFSWLKQNEENLKERKIVRIIATYSWEIYLTQTLIIPKCEIYKFPISLFMVLCGIIISAFLLKKIMKTFWSFIEERRTAR